MAQGDLTIHHELPAMLADGAAMRPCDPARDASAIAAIENELWVHAGFRLQATDEALLHNRWARAPQFAPHEYGLIVERAGEVLAYGMLTGSVVEDGSTQYSLQGGVRPQARRRGYGGALLRRLTDLAWRRADAGACNFEMTVLDGQADHAALAAAHGFAPGRRCVQMVRDLTRPIDEAPLPDRLCVQSPAPHDVRRVLEAREAAFRGQRGHIEATEDDLRGMEADPAAQPEGWIVAWDARTGEPVGAAQPGIYEPDNLRFGLQRGWLYWLWVRPPWRRRGVARALLARACAQLRVQGMREATLFADLASDGAAIALYEKFGFRKELGWTIWNRTVRDSSENGTKENGEK